MTEPAYRTIVADIRARIAAGTLRPGDRVPSTRQITRDFGVAMATATKALAALRQEGLVETRPRAGTVVAAVPSRQPYPERAPSTVDGLDRARIVHAAIGIADRDGLAALSMRSVAGVLGTPTMSLYRHVASKDDLVLLMTDAAFGEELPPADPPDGWRARLEVAARLQWTLYQRHPWLAHLVPLGRPVPLRNLLVHGDFVLRALDGHGLDPTTLLHAHIVLYSYVRGIAANLEAEAQARADTGLTEEEWVDSQEAAFTAIAASGDFPGFARMFSGLADGYDFDLDTIFEFGLRMTLDGIEALVRGAGN
jgi:DNA-binding transcriptional regulator YhcF (GntR family)